MLRGRDPAAPARRRRDVQCGAVRCGAVRAVPRGCGRAVPSGVLPGRGGPPMGIPSLCVRPPLQLRSARQRARPAWRRMAAGARRLPRGHRHPTEPAATPRSGPTPTAGQGTGTRGHGGTGPGRGAALTFPGRRGQGAGPARPSAPCPVPRGARSTLRPLLGTGIRPCGPPSAPAPAWHPAADRDKGRAAAAAPSQGSSGDGRRR